MLGCKGYKPNWRLHGRMSNQGNPKRFSLAENLHLASGNGKIDDPKRGSKAATESDLRAESDSRAGRKTAFSSLSEGDAVSADAIRESRNATAESASAAQVSDTIFTLPQRRARPPIGGIVSFILCVLLPTVVAAVYFALYASSQYVINIHFAVQDNRSGASAAAASGLSLLFGVSTAADPAENYMVVDYMTSQQAVEDLQSRIDLRSLYSQPTIDWWSRFDDSLPIEQFVRYWKQMTTASYDQITGTAIAQVRAFSPADALLIATSLLERAEDLVNEVARRPQREAVRYAENELKRAEDRLKVVRGQLSAYREKEALVDPNSSVVLGNATLASTLRATLAQLQADLAATKQQRLSATAPQVQLLQTRIAATQEQLSAVEGYVRSAGGDRSLSQVVARYEELDLERQFAQTSVLSALQALDQARSALSSQKGFLIPYVRPSMPESSVYPNRVVSVLTVAGVCFLLWTIALLISRSIREHLV